SGARTINKKAPKKVIVLTCSNCDAPIALGDGCCYCHEMKLIQGLVKNMPVKCSACFDQSACLCPEVIPDYFAHCKTCWGVVDIKASECQFLCEEHLD